MPRFLRDTIEVFINELSTRALSHPSEATVFFGINGLRTASEKMYYKLKRGETLYYLGVPAYQPKEQHIYWQKDHARRTECGIKVNILFNKDTDKRILANRNSYKAS